MGDTDEATPRKRRRVSMSEALQKNQEFQSSLSAAEWVFEQFEAADKNSKDPLTLKKRMPKVLDRVRNRISKMAQRKKKEKRPLPAEDLQQPALTDSMVDVLDGTVPDPKTSASSSQRGRPAQDMDEVCLRAQRYKLQPIIDKIKEAGEGFGDKTPTQVCGRVLQELNYTHNRTLGLIGKAMGLGVLATDVARSKNMRVW